MEKLLLKKERYGARTSILTNFKSLFVPFRYAPLHKERFKNSKLYLGLKIKCKFETGLRTKKCKLKSGRVKRPNPKLHTHWAFTPATARPKMPKEYAIATTVQACFNE